MATRSASPPHPRRAWRARAILVAATPLLCTAPLPCNALYLWPQQTRIYLPRSGRTSALRNAVVVTRDAGCMDFFQPLNCPKLDCDTIFAFAPDDATEQRLRDAFPGRNWYRVWDVEGVLTIAPGGQIGAPPAR